MKGAGVNCVWNMVNSQKSVGMIHMRNDLESDTGGCEMKKCLCGKPAVAVAYLPMRNIYAGLKHMMEKHYVCEYHAKKSIVRGFRVYYGVP